MNHDWEPSTFETGSRLWVTIKIALAVLFIIASIVYSTIEF